MRRLRSGDVEVMVPNQRAKDQALNQAEVAGCKVLRQDYPVEVPGVPLATGIKHGKALENEEVAKAICNATKRTIPGISINKIRWLHDAKEDVVQNCLFGVDIQQQAIEICRLRLWLSLVVDYDLGLDP